MSAFVRSTGDVLLDGRDALIVEVPLPPKTLSPNVKTHWAAKTRATKKYRNACEALFLRAVRMRAWTCGRVMLDVEYRCSKKAEGYVARDIQNAMAALKAMTDGLVDAGVAPNDSKAYLTWGEFNLVTTKSEKGDGVTVVVVRA